MTDASFRASALSYLRAPRFTSEDKRTPRQAILHAMPATLFFSANAWLIGIGIVMFFGLWFSAPFMVLVIAALIFSVPCALASWAIFVRCIEVEAGLDF
ncbi:hypothetical protein [Pelagibacterium sp. H642]|uniref:hypothetical protein n=1 Tax=Pelagibacterium sp. H642 TaxID=1881069 RepID=UPI0028154BEF|nr:hypothetical protein [Pelagibacterium sp. H642]WMT90973.1 hypothetical protein NO934_01590 [Pelagibacterium sp. H642]